MTVAALTPTAADRVDADLAHNLAGERLNRALGVRQREVVGLHLGERHATRFDGGSPPRSSGS
jgi:hypothetical protein